MLPANRHLLPIIGIDIHIVIILGAPVPLPHPFIGLVFDPMDWIPKIGSSVNVNLIPRGYSGTDGMLGTKMHIPMGGPFAMAPMIGHDSMNFFGSPRVVAEGSYLSGAGFMIMSCNDIGMPLSLPTKVKKKLKFSLYLPTSVAIPIPAGKPVIVGGPYVPDLMGMLMNMAMSFGFGALMKVGGKLMKKVLTKLNHSVLKKFKSTKSLGDFLCKHGFEPVNLITGSVLYEGLDFELPGPIPIRWSRRWYSDSGYEGLLGHGTHLSYDLSLRIFEEEDAIGVMLPDGRTAAFPLLVAEDEKYYHRSEKLTLTCKGRNSYELFDHNSELTYLFERRYDHVFKQSSISNLSGLSVKFYYNRKHCLDKIVDTVGREILITLDRFSRITKVTAQHNGQQRTFVEYGYNEESDLTAITDANGKTTSIQYENHLMVEKKDRNGQAFYWKYDGLSTGARCIHTYGDGGILEGHIEYKKGYNITTNSLGEQKTYYYDENDLCVQETDALGNSVFHEYTEYMEPYRDIDEEGNLTGYVYDTRGNRTAIQRPDGSAVNFLYNEEGKLQMVTDAEGGSTVYAYDGNLLKAIVGANKSVTAYEYDDAGLVKMVSNAKGQKTLLSYDLNFNLERIVLPDGAEASWQYDDWGRCLQKLNPEKQLQQFKYDVLDRVTSVRNGDGNLIQLEYNAYEEVVKASDKLGSVQFEYTSLGLLSRRKQNNTELRFNYDTEQRLTYLVNEANKVYRFGYNSRGEVIKEVGFDGLERSYERDRAGKVIRTQRPGGRSNLYEYDANGRIIRTEYHDGTWEIFSYDKNGNLTEAGNAFTSTRFKRNKLGQVEEEVQDGYTVESTYDLFGNRTSIQSSLGAAIEQQRDSSGNVTKLQATVEERVWQAQMKYNRAGQEIEKLLPGNIRSQWQYDSAGRPLAHIVKRGEQYQRSKSYNWKVDDRLSDIFDALSQTSTSFKHDAAGNLVWAKYGDNSIIHRQADDTGNLYETADRSDRKYGPGGQLLESKSHLYKYDEEGNLISKTDKQTLKKWHYDWYANGMLQKVTRPDSREVTFKYDAVGRRTEKCYNKIITRWVWNGNVPLHEWQYPEEQRPKQMVDEWGDITYDKPEPTEQLTTWIFDADSFRPAAKIINGQTHSIICDYLGTPQEMYDERGTKVWEGVLDIYGRTVTLEGKKSDCPFRYQGQYEDVETGLYYNRFRYYAPEEGMYVSQDPIRFKGNNPNFYGYVFDANSQFDVFGWDITWVNPNDLNYTQRTVSSKTSDGIPLDDLTKSMEKNGFDLSKGKPLNVMLVDGQLVSYDNRRLLAAQNANVELVPVNIVDPDAVHPDSTTGRTWRQKFAERRNDKRNKQAGGVVPEKGIKAKPRCT